MAVLDNSRVGIENSRCACEHYRDEHYASFGPCLAIADEPGTVSLCICTEFTERPNAETH